MSKFHHHWLLKGIISTPGPPPSYIMDFAFVITVATTTTFILSWYLIAPFSRGCVSAFLGEYVPYFFPTGFFRVFVSGRCTSNQYQPITGSHNLGPSCQSYFRSSTFQIFRVRFCVFYKFIFKKLSTDFVPWLSVSYVHGNNHI